MNRAQLKREITKLVRQMTGEPRLEPCGDPGLIDELIPEPARRGAVRLGLSRETLNKLLLCYGLDVVSESFFDHYFKGEIRTLAHFRACVDDIRQTSMRLFGNFKYGFKYLGEQKDVDSIVAARSLPNLEEQRRHWPEFEEIEEIEKEHLYLLSHHVTAEVADKAGVKRRWQEVRAKAKRNAQRYMALDPLDVYVGLTMPRPKDKEEYIRAQTFLDQVFRDTKDIQNLKLRWFNPMYAFLNDRVQTGLMDCLLVKKAKAMVYLAGKAASFGKDCEAATMLVQGKPVIVYVPEGRQFEQRAKEFLELHPLALQVELRTGVAHGVVVVRRSSDCVTILYRLLTNQLRTHIEEPKPQQNDNNFYLREELTGSAIRVVTKDRYLTNAFWEYYLREGDGARTAVP